jgi:positive regulator of sigma E activity
MKIPANKRKICRDRFIYLIILFVLFVTTIVLQIIFPASSNFVNLAFMLLAAIAMLILRRVQKKRKSVVLTVRMKEVAGKQ